MKYPLLIAGALVVVIASGYVFFDKLVSVPERSTGDSAAEEKTENFATETLEQGSLSGTGSLVDFFGHERSLHCTFNSDYQDDASSEGEFWYAHERMRVEATTRADGELYTSNMINDGTHTYVWGGTAAGMQAIMMENGMTEVAQEEYQAGQAEARINIEQQVSYDCQPWSADESRFTPPSDIEFMDMNQMMEGYFDGELRGMPEGMSF